MNIDSIVDYAAILVLNTLWEAGLIVLYTGTSWGVVFLLSYICVMNKDF